MQDLKIFFSVLIIGSIFDFIWFSLVASDLYKREVGSILRAKPDLGPAIIVYVLIALMVTFFVLPKAGSIGGAFLWGALAGLILYGVYDLTNMSFLKDWTWTAVLVDIIWGIIMCGAVSAIAAYLKRLF
jgi:uncharacterized membrane protein